MSAAVDRFATFQTPLHDPYTDAVAVTPSDTVDLVYVTRALVATVAGNISVNMFPGLDSSNPVVIPIAAGEILRIRASRVLATSTTATGIVALW